MISLSCLRQLLPELRGLMIALSCLRQLLPELRGLMIALSCLRQLLPELRGLMIALLLLLMTGHRLGVGPTGPALLAQWCHHEAGGVTPMLLTSLTPELLTRTPVPSVELLPLTSL